jgi:hypothetical protein
LKLNKKLALVQELKLNVPESATNILVFVHGFGVRWDSRGMFTDIEQSLPKSWGKVLFDLYKIDSKDVFVTSINEQVQRLSEVLGQLKFNYPDLKVHLLAHSQGCMITALLKPKISGKVILLAPPEKISQNPKPQSESIFKDRKIKKIKDGLEVTRRNGSKLFIPKLFTEQTLGTDLQRLIIEYSKIQFINILSASQDESLGAVRFSMLRSSKNIELTTIDGDHNFTARSRAELIKYVSQILTG